MLRKAVPLPYTPFLQDKSENMGVGAQQKLTMVTALQGVVTVLFLFACFVLKDWHSEVRAVQSQQSVVWTEVSVLKESVQSIKASTADTKISVDKMNGKLDSVLIELGIPNAKRQAR